MRSDETTPTTWDIAAKNIADPIRLTNVRVDGVAAASAEEGAQAKLWIRLFLTSDSPYFHRVADGLAGFVRGHAGRDTDLTNANSILLVIHPDLTADLWVNTAAVSLCAMAKRAVVAGEPVFDGDIVDITALDFPAVEIGSADKVLYLFREGWRFGLGFDFNNEKEFNRAAFTRELGTLYRKLKYRHLYELLENPTLFSRLTSAGWFPFSEIIGHEFKELLDACEAGFSLKNVETKLLAAFDTKRIDRILERWQLKPHFRSKGPLLISAANAYKNGDPIPVIKIILTEIEGILAQAYRDSLGSGANLSQLLNFAVEAAERKAGGPDTLFFPTAFASYMRNYTYATFDPKLGETNVGSRHAVGHGAATPESYTQIRALQAILTLDQLAFYT